MKKLLLLALCSFTLSLAALSAIGGAPAQAAAVISITSPQANQVVNPGPITVTGTASANKTVLVFANGTVLAQTISAGDGTWSASINVAANTTSITAKVIDNDIYGYFTSVAPNFSSASVNRINLSTGAINGGSYPTAFTGVGDFRMSIVTNKNATRSYLFGDLGSNSGPLAFHPNSPAAPVAVGGSWPATPATTYGAFSDDESIFYAVNSGDNSVGVIDTATDTLLSTIPVGSYPSVMAKMPGQKLYLVNSQGNSISIINTQTNTVVQTLTNICSDPTALATITAPHESQTFYYVSCSHDHLIKKYDLNNVLIQTIDTGAGFEPSYLDLSLDNTKIYTTFRPGTANDNKLNVYNLSDGSLVQSITLTNTAFAGALTPDGQYIYVATPGMGFSTSNIDVISTATNTITSHITSPDITDIVALISFTESPSTAQTSVAISTPVAQTATLPDTGQPSLLITLVSTALFIAMASLAGYGIYRRKNLR